MLHGGELLDTLECLLYSRAEKSHPLLLSGNNSAEGGHRGGDILIWAGHMRCILGLVVHSVMNRESEQDASANRI